MQLFHVVVAAALNPVGESPLVANVALAVLDEHAHGPWLAGGVMSTPRWRARRRAKGLPNWRIVRYADDFVILVHGTGHDAETLREDIARVLAPLGLRLSEAKTRVAHISEGLDFLGFRIQWRRKPGKQKWYVYTFIADRQGRHLTDAVGSTSNTPPDNRRRGPAVLPYFHESPRSGEISPVSGFKSSLGHNFESTS